jgi:hypothetical protein
MTDIYNPFIYGQATLDPNTDIIAGSIGTWILTIKIGKHGIDDGGHIKVAWRDVSDWNPPQFHDKHALNYTTIETSGKAKLHYEFKGFGHIRPWRPCLTITVYDGYLAENDTITIVYGCTNFGSTGSMAQTFIEDTFEFRVLVDPFGTGQYFLIKGSPTLKIIAGEPRKLSVDLPSETTLEKPTWLSTRIEDEWGNTCSKYIGTISLSSNNSAILMPKSYKFTPEDRGIHRFEDIVFKEPGIYHIKIMDLESNMICMSNPIQVFESRKDLNLYWGDLHGQTEETVGTGTVDQYFRYARDEAALDFASHVGNDFQITKTHFYDTQNMVKKYHIPNRFVTFLGYEWSGNTPAGGDHNVYFLKDDQLIHRSSHAQIDDISDEEDDRYPISKLYELFSDRDDVLIIPHIGGRRANLDFLKPDLTPFIEVSSVHGHFEWFIHEAIERKLQVGFIAGSDDHTCRPGKSVPTSKVEAVRGGLMGVYAHELTRESLWEAFQKRNVYATTGKRIILRFRCKDAIMGDEITINEKPTFSVEVIGTNSLEKVEIFRGLDSIYDHTFTTDSSQFSDKIKITWSGARVTTRRRNTDWSGKLIVKRGKILTAEEHAFDLPWDGIMEQSDNYIRWRSSTSGDEDGLILTLEANKETSIEFLSKPASFSFKIDDLDKPMNVEAGKIEQKVTVLRLPKVEPPSQVDLKFKDDDVERGSYSYCVKVKQFDGEKAWSSPIFIHYQP